MIKIVLPGVKIVSTDDPMVSWLINNVPYHDKNNLNYYWCSNNTNGDICVVFSKEEDAVAFRLKFGL